MLVLNTNEQIGRRLSNDILGGYPDFNAILMKPICPSDPINSINNYKQVIAQQNILITPETYKTKVYSVNGTAVNMICNVLDRDRLFDNIASSKLDFIELFNSGNSFYLVGENASNLNQFYTSISRNTKIRIGMMESLQSGAIIGKNIKANLNFTYNINLSGHLKTFVSNYFHNMKIELEFGLLRTNGAIQKIGTIPLINEQNKTFPMDKDLKERNGNGNFAIEGNFDGVVANEGDKVVIDVKSDIEINSTPQRGSYSQGQITYTVGIGFGMNASSNQYIPDNMDFRHPSSARPIQISIE